MGPVPEMLRHGQPVPLRDTLESFGALVDGELDQYPEGAFYNVAIFTIPGETAAVWTGWPGA